MTADGTRRDFFVSLAATAAMGGGLVTGYGTFVFYACRFLYPSGNSRTVWQFVTTIDAMQVGDARTHVTPAGAHVVIARQSNAPVAQSFMALSSVCPHLGCQVQWEPQHHRFFCPCHNGVFDPEGRPVSGPPAQANQSLMRFPLKVENGLLYIESLADRVVAERPADESERQEAVS